jgi:hypothetical protein
LCLTQRERGSATGDDGSDFDRVAVVEMCITGDQCAVADHQVRLAIEFEPIEQLVHTVDALDRDLPRRLPEADDHDPCRRVRYTITMRGGRSGAAPR